MSNNELISRPERSHRLWAKPAIYVASLSGTLGAYFVGFNASGRPLIEFALAIVLGLGIGWWVNHIAELRTPPAKR